MEATAELVNWAIDYERQYGWLPERKYVPARQYRQLLREGPMVRGEMIWTDEPKRVMVYGVEIVPMAE